MNLGPQTPPGARCTTDSRAHRAVARVAPLPGVFAIGPQPAGDSRDLVARGAIARGGQPKPKDIKLRSQHVPLSDLIEATRTVLRYAIARAVLGPREHLKWHVSWNEAIIDQLAGPN